MWISGILLIKFLLEINMLAFEHDRVFQHSWLEGKTMLFVWFFSLLVPATLSFPFKFIKW
jgi:hypothetical protein